MARTEARIAVSIWDDEDFLALPPGPQRLFLFLISQRDLAHTGVLALRERRWSKASAKLTPADVTADLEVLQETRFIVVDEDTEELLVRSFIRRDKVYRQPNVLRAAQDHLAVISSQQILGTLADELRRIARADDLNETSAGIVAEMIAALPKGSGNPSRKGSRDPFRASSEVADEPTPERSDAALDGDETDSQCDAADSGGPATEAGISAGREGSGNPSENPSAKATGRTPGERGVVTVVSSASPSPFPLSPIPFPLEAAAQPRPRKRESKPQTQIPSDFSITEEMRIWAKEHTPTVAGDLGLQAIRFVNYWTERAERRDKQALKTEAGWARAWQNWLIKAVEIQGGRPASSSTQGASRAPHQPYREDEDRRNDKDYWTKGL
jgi:hypothetical protein